MTPRSRIAVVTPRHSQYLCRTSHDRQDLDPHLEDGRSANADETWLEGLGRTNRWQSTRQVLRDTQEVDSV